MRVLLLLAAPAAFVCLINAGIALRREGGTVFWLGGGFSKWMMWAVIFLALEPTLTWFQSLGVPVFFPPGSAVSTPWLSNIQTGVTAFVEDLFVAEGFSSTREYPDMTRRPGRLYAFPMQGLYAVGVAGVGLGIARAMLAAFAELAAE
ncbi:MAG: hypothetical protein GY953_08140, partial [bacterium]|nr:hypothetical protein [bacterium]